MQTILTFDHKTKLKMTNLKKQHFEKAILPREMKEEFTLIAKKRGIVKSNILRKAIREFIIANR